MTPEQAAFTYDQIAQRWDCPEFDRSYGIEQHKRALRFVSGHGRTIPSIWHI
jgi:hypothetical protein